MTGQTPTEIIRALERKGYTVRYWGSRLVLPTTERYYQVQDGERTAIREECQLESVLQGRDTWLSLAPKEARQ